MAFSHKKESGLLYVKGCCTECAASWEGGGVQLQATRHFHNTGHKIRVEQGIWWTWAPVLDAGGEPKKKVARKKRTRR